MPAPTEKELRIWAEAYVRLWNAGDKEGWCENWKKAAPGDIKMWDPVGTPPKHGFDHALRDSFDLFQKNITFKTPKETTFFNGPNVAWVMQNHFERDGKATYANSIETFAFGDDGSCTIQTFYPIPKHDDEALGEMFQTYLPENDGKQ